MQQSTNIGSSSRVFSKTSTPFTSRRGRQRTCAGIGEDFRKALDSLAFENWAPRSSRAWRLPPQQQTQRSSPEAVEGSIDEGSISSLNARISQAGPVNLAAGEEESTSGVEDGQLAESFNKRLKELSGRSNEGFTGAFTGQYLRDAILKKYGKSYDLSIVRRQIPGKTLVALNVMWTHLEQQSFPMSEEEYDDKLDTIATYIDAWGQTQTVVDFFQQPAKSQRGLPSRPVVGCAVSIRLDLPPAVIEEWFG
ncbi:hypothetical protein WJX75_009975 [Coccomyxa subellipsoidea]|uniref:Uncharacterized protein n=1 Tax=Coccomyxa subellipsoidea TaxID=248742 RepID=A0ABR2YYW2_9CHLO